MKGKHPYMDPANPALGGFPLPHRENTAGLAPLRAPCRTLHFAGSRSPAGGSAGLCRVPAGYLTLRCFCDGEEKNLHVQGLQGSPKGFEEVDHAG